MRDLMLLFAAFVVFVRIVRGRRRPRSTVDELALRRALNKSMENRKHYATEDE
jgi:hypothetical protein